MTEFFKFAKECMLSHKVQGFPEAGYRYLDQQKIPETDINHGFNHRLTEFVKRLTPTPVEVAVRQHIIDYLCKRITEALSGLGNDFMVLPCGSSLSGTFLAEADIDLVLYHYTLPGNSVSIMETLMEKLSDLALDGEFQALAHAKVPVLKMRVEPDIQIDLTIDELHGPLYVGAVRRIFENYPSILPAQLFMKLLLRKNHLDQPYTGGISSYTLQILILAYVQHKGEPENLTEMIEGLCNFYGNEFNFTLTGIDVKRNGMFFSRYREKCMTLESPTTMYIVDPHSLTQNILGHNAFRMTYIRLMMRETANMLKEGRGDEMLAGLDDLMDEFDAKRLFVEKYAMENDIKF